MNEAKPPWEPPAVARALAAAAGMAVRLCNRLGPEDARANHWKRWDAKLRDYSAKER